MNRRSKKEGRSKVDLSDDGRRWRSYCGEAGIHAVMWGCVRHEGGHGENGPESYGDRGAPHEGMSAKTTPCVMNYSIMEVHNK